MLLSVKAEEEFPEVVEYQVGKSNIQCMQLAEFCYGFFSLVAKSSTLIYSAE